MAEYMLAGASYNIGKCRIAQTKCQHLASVCVEFDLCFLHFLMLQLVPDGMCNVYS